MSRQVEFTLYNPAPLTTLTAGLAWVIGAVLVSGDMRNPYNTTLMTGSRHTKVVYFLNWPNTVSNSKLGNTYNANNQ
jgi:hypothetical protein